MKVNRPPSGVVGLRVRDGGVLLHEPLVPDLRLVAPGIGSPLLLGGPEHPGRGAERVELEHRPLALIDAVVEADECPPVAVDEDREDGDRSDVLLDELDALFLRELADDAVHGRARQHQFDPPGEARVGQRRPAEGRVPELRGHARRAPLGELGRPISVLRCVDLDEVRAAHARRHAEVHQDVVDRVPPIGGEEKSLGRVGDGCEHGVAREHGRFMLRRSSHAYPPKAGCDPFFGPARIIGVATATWSPLLGVGCRSLGGSGLVRKDRQDARHRARGGAPLPETASAPGTWPPA